MDALGIIDKYYRESGALRLILLTHSKRVARKALEIADRHPEMRLDRQFLHDAAMLHDIGIIRCDAPGIGCHGTQPYICHGLCGARMLREGVAPGLTAAEAEPYARVCERHTGAGLSAKEIRERGLPLPEADFLPETREEKLICYADKFFSKTEPEREKPVEKVILSMEKFGAETAARFLELHEMFR